MKTLLSRYDLNNPLEDDFIPWDEFPTFDDIGRIVGGDHVMVLDIDSRSIWLIVCCPVSNGCGFYCVVTESESNTFFMPGQEILINASDIVKVIPLGRKLREPTEKSSEVIDLDAIRKEKKV